MTSSAPRVLALIGPPGAGCSSVGHAVATAMDLPVLDLARRVADELGTGPDLALVAVPEAEYRRVESRTAISLLDRAVAQGAVVVLGSGCLADPQTRRRLEDMRGHDRPHRVVVALTCATRVLTTRNGLDAPRSVALGTVHHQFVQMLHERESQCRELADIVVDTSSTTPQEAGEQVIGAMVSAFFHHS